ncbi:hypothetical protein LX64_00944 [Chitinophaga skermanii]|uniref:Uncharacterized protein n=1 Tax=Chitinophaga skermanii TaxID=331697 RepID=A0A327R336_9BACT|nr:hypothetical protein [Chitinophaga skermanii]RAJ08297.1 hypothetical protein LX64_00944 [Chitinophaga skermanii]
MEKSNPLSTKNSRIFLTAKDLMAITGFKERATRNLIARIKKKLGINDFTPLTIFDVADELRVTPDELKKYL